MTKTALKTITLYDIITANQTLLLGLLYNMVTLIINHYSIKYLEYLKSINPTIPLLDEIQANLHICQSITMIVSVGILCVFRTKKTLNQEISGHDMIILLIKYIGSIAKQICIFTSNIAKPIYLNNTVHIDPIYDLITFMYEIHLIASSFILFMFIFALLMILIGLLDYGFKKIITWTKTQKIQYIEQTETDETETV
jgi:hypothetical protein